MLKRIALLFVTLITILCSLPIAANMIAVSAEEVTDSDVVITQSIEDDLASFDFDYTRYCLDKENYLHPVVITYKESNNPDYYDLLYVYARLDPIITNNPKIYHPIIEFNSIDVDLYYSNKMETLYDNASNEHINFKFIYSDKLEVNENGFIYRLVLDEYDKYRESNFREYNFTNLNYTTGLRGALRKQNVSLELDNTFLFDNEESVIYSNCLNVLMEDPHCWSYHFDEDGWWENTWESFWGQCQDLLTDQLFYSFYVDNWNISELKSIDIRYKKVLLDGYRYNQHDTGKEKEFYQGTTGTSYDPKYYLWNDNNSKDNFNHDVYLGNSIQQASNSVSYTYKTINGDVVNQAVTQDRSYKWDSILNNVEFMTTFGAESDIYKHASNFLTDPLKEYWIINFDQFYYKFSQIYAIYSQYVVNYLIGFPVYQDRYIFGYNSDFFDYLLDNGYSLDDLEKWVDPMVTSGSVGYDGLRCYHFMQEYVFDMTATQMTFEDNNKVTHTLPVSVAPVNEESSGGGSIDPIKDFDFSGLLTLLALLFGILILICFFPLIGPLLTLLINIITIPFKWIGSLFDKKE